MLVLVNPDPVLTSFLYGPSTIRGHQISIGNDTAAVRRILIVAAMAPIWVMTVAESAGISGAETNGD
jgi:hypothetical protein